MSDLTPDDSPIGTEAQPADPSAHAAAQTGSAYQTGSPTMSPAPAGPQNHSGVALAVALAVVAAIIVGGLSGLAGGFMGARLAGVITGAPSSVTVLAPKTPEAVAAAAAAAVPSVVNIDVRESASNSQSNLPTSHPAVPLLGTGSGVAFKRAPRGATYILTNNHVVENATRITVRDASGKGYPGKLVGRDTDSDIAVVLIDAQLPLISLGDSGKLVVGQTAVAIGSPFGLDHSVTSGVISALGRSLPAFTSTTAGSYPLVDVIQTDAAINPGNSGGALVDRFGKLVGINTAIYSASGASGGIGFAIPVNTAVRVADSLISTGKVGHPFLGIIGSSVTPDVATAKKLPVQEGALVEDVTKGSGSSNAGVRAGDIVTAVNGTPVRSMDNLILLVRRHAVGDTITLTILRGGKTLSLKVIVADRPSNFSSPNTPTTPTPTPTPKK
jgi:S1-C subfamily serine protease